jgi:hypothetical protein
MEINEFLELLSTAAGGGAANVVLGLSGIATPPLHSASIMLAALVVATALLTADFQSAITYNYNKLANTNK